MNTADLATRSISAITPVRLGDVVKKGSRDNCIEGIILIRKLFARTAVKHLRGHAVLSNSDPQQLVGRIISRM
jgi:hypothetical protein